MERSSKGIGFTLAIAAVAGVSLLVLLAVLNRRDQTVGFNQEIQFDDFAFSVQAVRKVAALAKADAPPANGVYYVVTIRIANHARRVDYRFKKTAAILVDGLGREFHWSPEGQQALETTENRQCDAPIPAGGTCVTDVVFDLPVDAKVARLKISEGGLVGDILEVVFFGKKRITLESPQ